MGDRHPLTQGQHPEGASGVSSSEINMTLSPYAELQHDLGEAYRKYKGYADIIAEGGPLAPQFYDSIFCSEVEKTAARSFGQPRPHMVGGNTQKPIEWTDVLREMLTPGDFQRQPNGMYRCCIRGSLIEITEANYTEILTGVTERLLQPLQNLSSAQKETRVRLKLGSDLYQTHHKLVQFANAVRTSLQALNSPPPIHVANPSSTGHEAQPPTPLSAPPKTSGREVIYISDSEGDNNGNSGNSNPAASALARCDPPGIIKTEPTGNDNPGIKEEPVNSGPSDVLPSIDSATDTKDFVLPADLLQRGFVNSASDSDDYVPPTDTLGSNSSDSVSDTGYAVSSTDIMLRYSTDYPNNMDDDVSSTHVSRRGSANWASDSNNDAQSIDHPGSNTIDSARDTNENAGLIAFILLRAAGNRMSNRNFDAGLVDSSTTFTVNNQNHVVENTDANTSANAISNVNANAESSGLTSEAVTQLVRPWLLNINNPDNANNDNAQSHSSGSGIPWQSKPEEASHSTGTAAGGKHGARSHDSKRPRAESSYNEEWSMPHPARRYSQLEEEEGPRFVKYLVEKGSTTTEVEEEYTQVFGVTRTAGAIFKKFKIKGAWALLKPLREAKKQKTMVPSPHYSTLIEKTLLTTAFSQPSLAMIDTHAHSMRFEPGGLRIQIGYRLMKWEGTGEEELKRVDRLEWLVGRSF
ncbi:hypothetical protein N7463_002342 [Penicillium fimorum]|uniref:Uncharacterized protein n=1 Tax=Penicillium fimorum TaxID=1882269 RepID=A0A9W9Y0A2_9EURO|nr:hypothetical protein N7463_002342 [Penicillium fimorum]